MADYYYYYYYYYLKTHSALSRCVHCSGTIKPNSVRQTQLCFTMNIAACVVTRHLYTICATWQAVLRAVRALSVTCRAQHIAQH